jgi:hypothetical protein
VAGKDWLNFRCCLYDHAVIYISFFRSDSKIQVRERDISDNVSYNIPGSDGFHAFHGG